MNIKSQKGSMILYVLIAMLVITAVAVGMFVTSANKQRMQLEAISEMQKIYDNGETPAEAYQRYIGGEIIPIYTAEQLRKIGSGETLTIDGKGYTFNDGCTYVLKNDITLEQNFKTVQDKIKNGDINFEGQGHTITVTIGGNLRIYTAENNYQIYKMGAIETETNEYLKLIEHFDDNTTYTSVTSNSTTLSTSNKKFGNGSRFFNNTYIQYPSSNDYIYTGDFTIDFWLYLSSTDRSGIHGALINAIQGGTWIGILNEKFVVRRYDVANYIEATPPTANEWHHIAVCRKDDILYLFYDGTLQSTGNFSGTFETATMYIGTDGAGNVLSNSYIDELRILNGYGQWTENFDVPTKAYDY